MRTFLVSTGVSSAWHARSLTDSSNLVITDRQSIGNQVGNWLINSRGQRWFTNSQYPCPHHVLRLNETIKTCDSPGSIPRVPTPISERVESLEDATCCTQGLHHDPRTVCWILKCRKQQATCNIPEILQQFSLGSRTHLALVPSESKTLLLSK